LDRVHDWGCHIDIFGQFGEIGQLPRAERPLILKTAKGHFIINSGQIPNIALQIDLRIRAIKQIAVGFCG
jgi:hypothetical protein